MKKIAILSLALLAFNAFGWEVQVKAGYDFYRGYSDLKNKSHEKMEDGFILGIEGIPYNKGILEAGVGLEYNFGRKTPFLKTVGTNQGFVIPVYALGKVKMVRSKDNAMSLYGLARVGYAFAKDQHSAVEVPTKGGLYYGAGIGFEVYNFVMEGLYDGRYYSDNGISKLAHKAGIRIGVRFGDYKIKPKILRTKGKLIHASCNEAERKCVIHGFAVDGRVPNEEEKINISEISQLINGFTKSGYVDVTGHTDSTYTDDYNKKLSVTRAQNVSKLLREYGLKNTIIFGNISGKGKSLPIDTNDTKEGRYNNRRVELKFRNLKTK